MRDTPFKPGDPYSVIPGPDDVAAWLARPVTFDFDMYGIDVNVARQLALLENFDLREPTHGKAKDKLYFANNDQFGHLDAMFLDAFLRWLKPATYFEIGSGYSTAVALDTGLTMQVITIDPDQSRLDSLTHGMGDYTAFETSVQHFDPIVFAELEAGDLLFIDSTHAGKLGSDVLHELFVVLPRIKTGVYVHFHDIFYPFEYPRSWIEENRAWNEAYLLRALLTKNPDWEIVLWPDLLIQRGKIEKPACCTGRPGSLYLRRT